MHRLVYIRVPNGRLPCICYTRETGIGLISVDVLVSCTARNTSSSLNFRYDAYRNRNDRKACVNGSYACRDFVFVIV